MSGRSWGSYAGSYPGECPSQISSPEKHGFAWIAAARARFPSGSHGWIGRDVLYEEGSRFPE